MIRRRPAAHAMRRAPPTRPAVRRPSDRRSRSRRASTPAKSSRRRASAPRAPTHPMRAARSEYDAPSVRAADASDIGLQRPARYGQNDREIALGRKNYLFAGSDAGGERAAAAYTLVETALCRARHKAVYAARRTMPNGSATDALSRRICGPSSGHLPAPFGIVWSLTAPRGRRAGGRLGGSGFACRGRTASASPGRLP